MNHRTLFLLTAFATLLLPDFSFARSDTAIFSTGRVVAKNMAVVSAKIVSHVVAINHDVGEKVNKGDILVTLDDREFNAAIALAEGHVLEATAVLENATSTFTRIETLQGKGSATRSAFDSAKADHLRAKAGLAIAKAQLLKAEIFLEYTTLKSPVTGTIDYKKIEVGELTAPGGPLIKVTDEKNLRFETGVRESDINSVNRGDEVTVLIDALPGVEIRGKVAHVAPSGDPATHSFTVRIDLPEAEGLRIGMYGKARWK